MRYRKNVRDVMGKPDLAFVGKKVAVFCDSEFWHGFDWDNQKNQIKTNSDFWISKIERNIERDREVDEHLRNDGWIVLRFWGREIKEDVSRCADEIEKVVKGR